jgi:hypothetical protein
MSQSGNVNSIREKLRAAFNLAAAYLDPLTGDFGKNFSLRKTAAAALLVIAVAAGVRLLHLDDIIKNPGGWDPMVPNGGVYVREAVRIRNAGFMPKKTNPDTHAARLLHPPGYVLYLIGLFKLMGWDDRHGVMIAQAMFDSVAAALALIFTAWTTNLRTGLLAGILIAISPHHARISLFVSPESLFVLPIMLAVCCLYLASGRRHRMRYYVCAGLFFGLACWLRSNGLLMSPFFAVISVAAARERREALKGALAMVLITAAAIAPITMRNYVITKRFIPLSVGLGVILMQAVADYDFDKKYGLPKLDPEVALKEAEWYNRPDYARHFLRPDGIERDNARLRRTLGVIGRHPAYYLSTVARRVDFMLRCDLPPGPDEWPFNTATPIWVSKHTMYGHGAPEQLTGRDVLSMDGKQLAERLNTGEEDRIALSTDEPSGTTTASLAASSGDDQELLRLPPIEVNPRTDYVISVDATVDEGSITAVVRGDRENRELRSKLLGRPGEDTGLSLPFASQDNTRVGVTFANDRAGQEPCRLRIRSIKLIEIGSTPYSWTDHFRWAVRALQRNLYATLAMRALWIIGLGVLLLIGRRREALWIAAVPLYYVLFQSLLHTEYRYIIPMHYFLNIFAAIGLHTLVHVLRDAIRRVSGAARA